MGVVLFKAAVVLLLSVQGPLAKRVALIIQGFGVAKMQIVYTEIMTSKKQKLSPLIPQNFP